MRKMEISEADVTFFTENITAWVTSDTSAIMARYKIGARLNAIYGDHLNDENSTIPGGDLNYFAGLFRLALGREYRKVRSVLNDARSFASLTQGEEDAQRVALFHNSWSDIRDNFLTNRRYTPGDPFKSREPKSRKELRLAFSVPLVEESRTANYDLAESVKTVMKSLRLAEWRKIVRDLGINDSDFTAA